MDNTKVKKHRRTRLLIQACAAAACNGYLRGFARGKIYEGASKYICVPGMNCYSCPGALGSCPIGSLQAILTSREYRMAFYVIGLLTVFGTLFGRLICGFLCPFGLVQDLLFKIPFIRRLQRLPGEKALRMARYIILAVFVILLPMLASDLTGIGKPWFCKYICPVGTLEGGIPLVLLNKGLRSAIGFLYTWKVSLLILTLLMSVVLYRPFCRYICPLGAIYGLFNRFSFYRYQVDADKCTGCGICRKTCKLGIAVWENPNSADCIRCGECLRACPRGALAVSPLPRPIKADCSACESCPSGTPSHEDLPRKPPVHKNTEIQK